MTTTTATRSDTIRAALLAGRVEGTRRPERNCMLSANGRAADTRHMTGQHYLSADSRAPARCQPQLPLVARLYPLTVNVYGRPPVDEISVPNSISPRAAPAAR
jgi:hypothetical protein